MGFFHYRYRQPFFLSFLLQRTLINSVSAACPDNLVIFSKHVEAQSKMMKMDRMAAPAGSSHQMSA